MKSKENRRPSESFIAGVVVAAFLITGYQTAVFVFRSAVARITANRDVPDTVYVYGNITRDENQKLHESQRVVVRKNAIHSSKAESVRENQPRKNVESFVFNPNTVSEEDLCRLGFTPKQARSIVNYRDKGGRFRRKSDFADSYVVSDSIFRRLESYIDIPLIDLNLADSADFDSLPGIGGWYASRMVEYRSELKGYSCKEQLMDIWKFDREKFDALSDLVVVNPENISPYQLWTYPADTLRLHPYIGNYETARAIVLFRETTPTAEWSVQKLSAAGILSETAAEKLSACVIAMPQVSPAL